MPNTIFLRLEGPLQSWGERGRWSVRDTAPHPTKSGIIGLIACALGYREDEDIRPLSQKTRLGIRVDAPGTLITDYHTIGGGYDRPALLTAQGKPKKTPAGEPHTELSHRDYLCEASFLAALQIRDSADEPLIEQMAHALQNPVWPLFLGRKACIPSRPIFVGMGDRDDLHTALTQELSYTTYSLARQRPGTTQTAHLPLILELDLEREKPEGTLRRDNIHSRRHRVFHPRYTTQHNWPITLHKEDIDHVSIQITTE